MCYDKPGKPPKDDLELFDPITGAKTKTNYIALTGITGLSQSCLSKSKSKRSMIKSLGCFLIDSKFTASDLLELMDKVKVDSEIWKSIDEKGVYQISSLGRVRRTFLTRKPKFLMPYLKKGKKNNWLHVKVNYKNKYQEKPIHRLVGEFFCIRDSKCKIAVVHKNGNCLDNRADNLEWVTQNEVAKIGRKSFSIPVLKLDPNTLEVLDEFPSMKEAALSVYVVPETLRQCVNGDINTAGGFKWIVDEELLGSYF